MKPEFIFIPDNENTLIATASLDENAKVICI
jgi:hypothetical protein